MCVGASLEGPQLQGLPLQYTEKGGRVGTTISHLTWGTKWSCRSTKRQQDYSTPVCSEKIRLKACQQMCTVGRGVVEKVGRIGVVCLFLASFSPHK